MSGICDSTRILAENFKLNLMYVELHFWLGVFNYGEAVMVLKAIKTRLKKLVPGNSTPVINDRIKQPAINTIQPQDNNKPKSSSLPSNYLDPKSMF